MEWLKLIIFPNEKKINQFILDNADCALFESNIVIELGYMSPDIQ